MVLNLMKNIYCETVFDPFGAASYTQSVTPGCNRGQACFIKLSQICP